MVSNCDNLFFFFLFQRLTGLSPFAGEDKQETCYNVSLGALDFPEDYFKNILILHRISLKESFREMPEWVRKHFVSVIRVHGCIHIGNHMISSAIWNK